MLAMREVTLAVVEEVEEALERGCTTGFWTAIPTFLLVVREVATPVMEVVVGDVEEALARGARGF